MARTAPLKTLPTNTKKRKSEGDVPDPKRQRTMDAFFTPRVLAAGCPKNDKEARKSVELNAEQNRVLKMVVEEGKNVFFTGAAGGWFDYYPWWLPTQSLCCAIVCYCFPS
ncbi:hypothetical protein OBBRIDRAFT_622982 [Obba rivulosa]|uniref:Uncharacterized protein n=1 Tax=Obba rivulosa TaxID=1052685 RepID=A0A8E2AXN9_9APHY|nr:hypothetical protein OBBRIDRAFT_622982 [Obba rivulosa]